MDIPVIYLDQFMWIKLARVYYGKEQNEDIKNVLDILMESSKNGRSIVPLSPIHLIETTKSADTGRRDRLADFMTEVSCGYSLPPWFSILDIEIKNAFINRVGGTPIDLKKEIVDNGLTHLLCNYLGSKPYIVGINPTLTINRDLLEELPLSEEIKKSLLEYDGSEMSLEEFTLKIMDDKTFFSFFIKKGYTQTRPSSTKDIKELEEIREEIKQQFSDNESRKKEDFRRNIRSLVYPRAYYILLELGFTPDIIRNCVYNIWTEKDWFNLAREIPSFYTNSILSADYYFHYDTPITENDLNDLNFLACAIPYCDVVGCDKKFYSIAQRYELDKKYNHSIINNLTDLISFIS